MNNSNSDIPFGNENSIRKDPPQGLRTLNFDNSETVNEISKPKIPGPLRTNKANAM